MAQRAVGRILALLTPQERREGWRLLGLVVLMALFELIGVAAIMPFLAVLADPGAITSNALLARLHGWLGAPAATDFLLLLGLGAILLILTGAGVRILTEYRINRFIMYRVHSLGTRLLASYLAQPYEFFLGRHGGGLQKTILSEAERVVSAAIWPGLLLIANGAVLLALVTLLIVVEPVVALSTGVVLGLTYGAIFLAVRRRVRRIGAEAVAADRARFEAAGEALAGIKDIRLRGGEAYFLGRFEAPSRSFARHQALSYTLAHVPKYAVEAVAFGGLIALALVMMLRHGGAGAQTLGSFLPLIGLYAFAGVRMLPAVQGVYRGITLISFGDAAVESLGRDLAAGAALSSPSVTPPAPMPLRQALVLERVSYRYPGAAGPGLQDVSVTIPAGSTVGVVGRTGAGKTTLIDVILGLLAPTAGRLLADGVAITPERVAAWQASVGYVPQDIFLLDAPVAENIALGVPPERIDPAALARAVRMAQLDAVVAGLPEGLATRVGERGVRLSGGQRQRIGIARALYADPALLVFDEATSALDTATERDVMEAIAGLAGQKTVVMIAHRLTTVQACDSIIVLENGRLVGQGSFEDLIAGNPAFREIASAA